MTMHAPSWGVHTIRNVDLSVYCHAYRPCIAERCGPVCVGGKAGALAVEATHRQIAKEAGLGTHTGGAWTSLERWVTRQRDTLVMMNPRWPLNANCKGGQDERFGPQDRSPLHHQGAARNPIRLGCTRTLGKWGLSWSLLLLFGLEEL